METGSHTTTVDFDSKNASPASVEDFETLLNPDGEANVMGSFVAERYMKKLSTEIVEPKPVEKTTRDDYELHGYEERKTLSRRLGFHAVANAFRSLDRNVAYGTAVLISKFPRTKTREEREEYQNELNEKYADYEEDSWVRRRWNSIQRNRMNIRDRVPFYGVISGMGAMALYRYSGVMLSGGGNFITEKYDDFNDWMTKPRTVTQGDYSGADLAANSINYTPVQHEMNAEPTVLVMGGHTQGDAEGSGYKASLEAAGVINANEKVVPVDWSAQMGSAVTGPGAMTMEASDQEGAARLMDAVRDQGNAPIKIVSFSQGTEATLRALNQEYGGKLPDNVEVVLIGTPSGRFGMSNNALVGATNPILSAMGFEIDQPIPEGNVTIRTHVNDVFSNSADQSGAFTGLMALSPGHQVVDENNAVLLYTYQEGTTKYEVWGSPSGMNHPVSQLLEVNGMPVSPELNNLFEAAVPRTPHGEPTRYTDVGQTADALGVYLDTQTGGIPLASGAIDAVMTPQVTEEFQDFADLQKLPDQIAKGDIPGAMNTVSEALNTGMGYLENPNKITDMANDALGGAGIPFQVPALDQFVPQVEQFIPQPPAGGHVDTALNLGIPLQAMPEPAAAPELSPFTPPPQPAAAPSGYAPVGDLFTHSPNAGQYAPVGNLFS